MKVLHLISSGGMYGAENVVAALVRNLNGAGHSASVGLFENAHIAKNNVADLLVSRGVPVVQIPCNGRVDRGTVRTIREIVAAEQIDILHLHGYKADIYGYFAARKLDVPVVSTCHLWTRQTPAIRVYEFLDALFLRRFDAVVAVSDMIAEEARRAGIAAEKVTTIDNGIDLSPFSSATPTLQKQDGRLLIGAVGRLVSQKGMDYFLRAARAALAANPELNFVIVGDGPDRGKLEQLAKELAIDTKVTFAGSRADMPGVYASLDLFVLASLDEGMPMVVLEALASSRPVIATDVGAVQKLIHVGKTGMLVPPANVQALTQAILDLARNPNLRDQLGRQGKALVETQYSSAAMTQKYLKIYKTLLERKQEVTVAENATESHS
jgi:glycosyltransferase involved in cell wall biosynthesis